jgi:hypothetical protein
MNKVIKLVSSRDEVEGINDRIDSLTEEIDNLLFKYQDVHEYDMIAILYNTLTAYQLSSCIDLGDE